MSKNIKIAAFGALNQGSYDMFAERMNDMAQQSGCGVSIAFAGPYPNAKGVTEPGRPLRADALKDPAMKEELLAAVANDARALGDGPEVFCMPCMSMIGFHDGVEKKLGRPIVRLADALKAYYADVPKLGVIHMRPAKDRVKEMFGDKAVTPDEAQAAALLAAEEQSKKDGNPAAVEAVMKDLTESFRDQGLTHVLFARADAPMAQKSAAGKVAGIKIDSYFDVLAQTIANRFCK